MVDPGIDGGVMLKCVLRNTTRERERTGLIELRIRTSNEPL